MEYELASCVIRACTSVYFVDQCFVEYLNTSNVGWEAREGVPQPEVTRQVNLIVNQLSIYHRETWGVMFTMYNLRLF